MNTLATEKQLTGTLAAWSAVSVVGGSALWLAGHRSGRHELACFGRQSVLWGAVDGAIAAAGIVGRRRRDAFDDDTAIEAHRVKLKTTLLLNAGADVAYVAGGVAVLRRARSGRRSFGMGTGDGVAIVVQGGFLLALDTVFALRLWR